MSPFLKNIIDPLLKYNVVQIELKGQILEEENSLDIPFVNRDKPFTILKLNKIFNHIADSSIEVLVVKIINLSIGFARASDLASFISNLRERGKRVYVYLENPGNVEYFIASYADMVVMPPWSTLNLIGLAAETYFLKDFLTALGIEPEIFGYGKYKSSAEMFSRDSISEPHKEMINSILNEQFDKIISSISQNRKMKDDELKEIIDRAPFLSDEAKDFNLVDKICYEDELKGIIEEDISKELRELEYKKFSRIIKFKEILSDLILKVRGGTRSVGFVAISGIITHGKSRIGNGIQTSGSETIIDNLRKAAEDKNVQSIVLRIISPGGSALASDLIRNEVKKISEKKPVVISMSDLAASGGYLASLGGDFIFANEFTLTGSIGVISGKFNVKSLFKKLRINSEILKKGKMSTMFSINKSFTVEEKEKFDELVREMYENFVSLVSNSRQLSYEEAENASKGRVWTSNQAHDNGLIDEIGGLSSALEKASVLAGQDAAYTPNVKVFKTSQKLSFGYISRFAGFSLAENEFSNITNLAKERVFTLMPFWLYIN